MFKKNAKSGLRNFGIPALFLAAGAIAWELLASMSGMPGFLFPKLSEIVLEILKNLPFLLSNAGITMAEALMGFVIGNMLGFILAAIFVHFKTAERGVYPLAIIFKTVPLVALAPFLIIMFGIGISSKIAIVSIACFFPILVNTIKGLRATDRESLDLFKSLSASRWQTFIKLRIPNSLPYVFPALKTSAMFSVLGAIMGEFVGANAGIGYLILASAQMFDMPAMFATIAVSSLAGLLFFGLICLAEEKIVFWQKNEWS